jgi:hypothetical protein
LNPAGTPKAVRLADFEGKQWIVAFRRRKNRREKLPMREEVVPIKVSKTVTSSAQVRVLLHSPYTQCVGDAGLHKRGCRPVYFPRNRRRRGKKCTRVGNTIIIAFPASRPARSRPRDVIVFSQTGRVDGESGPSAMASHGRDLLWWARVESWADVSPMI